MLSRASASSSVSSSRENSESDVEPKPATLVQRILQRTVPWTVSVLFCFGLAYVDAIHARRDSALHAARESVQKDLLYRIWSTKHGGVYVPKSQLSPPNPYLDLPDRDISCSNGRSYTLINPAYMTRQIHELGSELYGLRGHITSLRPIRPENAPDFWERDVLKRFESGSREHWEEIEDNGALSLRYMAAFLVQPGCLRCHAKQGYREGDVRGGISAVVPLSSGYYATLKQTLTRNGIALGSLWLVGMLGIVWLARREQNAERRAFEANEMRAAMFSHGGVGLLLVSPELRIIAINPRACELLSGRSAELCGLPLESLHGGPEDFDSLLCELGHAVSETSTFEWLVRRRDGQTLWCTVTTSPLDPGKPECGAIWGLTDTSTLHATQEALTIINQELLLARDQALSADRIKSEFLSNMSHELRTPLHAILGMVEELARSRLTEDQAACLSAIDRSSDGLLVILNNILDFSKLEAGQVQLDRVTFGIREELLSVTHLFDSQLDHNRVTLSLSIENDVPKSTLGDPVRFRQIISNLLSNAVKFTAKGQISVSVNCLSKDPPNCWIRCEVQDTGIGIPEARQGKLFLPFSQADSSSTRRYGGTGLGLMLVKRLAEAMHGRVSFHSREQEGSTFVVELPLDIGESDLAEAAHTKTELNQSCHPQRSLQLTRLVATATGVPQILVVDDTLINQLVAAKIVESAGGKVSLASGGIEAVQMCKRTTFDAVLMDCLMPDMDGYEATRQIREFEAQTSRHVPIIAVTASALAEDRARCLEAGMDDYMSKPVASEALVRCINQWLKKTPVSRTS